MESMQDCIRAYVRAADDGVFRLTCVEWTYLLKEAIAMGDHELTVMLLNKDRVLCDECRRDEKIRHKLGCDIFRLMCDVAKAHDDHELYRIDVRRLIEKFPNIVRDKSSLRDNVLAALQCPDVGIVVTLMSIFAVQPCVVHAVLCENIENIDPDIASKRMAAIRAWESKCCSCSSWI